MLSWMKAAAVAQPVHAGGGVEAVRPPERRMQVAERVAGLAVAHAAAVGAVAGGAGSAGRARRRGPDPAASRRRAAAPGPRPGRRSCRRRRSASRGRRRSRASRAPSSGSARPFIERVMQPLTRSASDLGAAAGQRLRVLRRDPDQRQAVARAPRVDVAALRRRGCCRRSAWPGRRPRGRSARRSRRRAGGRSGPTRVDRLAVAAPAASAAAARASGSRAGRIGTLRLRRASRPLSRRLPMNLDDRHLSDDGLAAPAGARRVGAGHRLRRAGARDPGAEGG